MKLPLIDYRQFRLSRLNTPQFRHLKLLLFWPIFSLVFCYLENYRPTVYYAPMRCALDHWIPFCKWFVIPYAFWFLFVGGMLLYTNVCPSIHVIGSFAVYFAARDIRRFRAKGWRLGFLTMAVLISLSTVFLKQHSVLDVLAGLAVCAAAYPLIYRVPAGAASLIPAGGLGRKRFPEL